MVVVVAVFWLYLELLSGGFFFVDHGQAVLKTTMVKSNLKRSLQKLEGILVYGLDLVIVVYQYCLSADHSFWGKHISFRICRFQPSCSQFVREALVTQGLIRGLSMSFCRVIRCNPLCRSGKDLVPIKERIGFLHYDYLQTEGKKEEGKILLWVDVSLGFLLVVIGEPRIYQNLGDLTRMWDFTWTKFGYCNFCVSWCEW